MSQDQVKVRCARPGCGKPLPVILAPGMNFAVADFPDALLACLLQLAYGPTAVPCIRCGHANEIAQGAVWLGPGRREGVLYLKTPKHVAAARRAIAEHIGHRIALDVTYDPRSYRRTVLGRFIMPHAATLNAARLAGGNPLRWVREHEGAIGYAFMAAMWLLLSGAVPMFGQPIEEGEDTSEPSRFFRRHEEVKDRITEQGQYEARRQIAETVGDILAYRLLIATDALGKERSFQGILERIGTYCPRELLLEPAVRDQLAKKIREIVALFRIGEKGAIFARYSIEALHALLHHACGTDNPRRRAWTQILVAYEFRRRRDGNDETFLLPPEIVRQTIDEDGFWQEIREFGRRIDAQTSEGKAAQQDLVDTVERIFPKASDRLAEPWIALPGELSDEEAERLWLTGAKTQFLGNAEIGPIGTEMLVRGVAMHRPGLVRHFAERLFGLIEVGVEDPALLLRHTNKITEVLNRFSRYATALAIAERARQRLDQLGGATVVAPSSYAPFLNELGNCYRYAGHFDEALSCYDEAAKVYGGDAGDHDWRVVERNRGIVLRSTGRLSEARAIFEHLRSVADHHERPGLVLSEALCWLMEGRRDRALEMLEAHLVGIQGRSLGELNVDAYVTVLAQMRLNAGKVEETEPLFEQIADWAGRTGDVALAAAMAANLLKCRRARLDEAAYAAEREKVIETLHRALPRAVETRGIPSLATSIAEELSYLLLKARRVEEAEKVVRDAVEELPADTGETWLLMLRAAEIANLRHDQEQLVKDLTACLATLHASVAAIDPASDPYALLSDREHLLRRLTSHLIKGTRDGWLNDAAPRLAADIQASPVLSTRLGSRLPEIGAAGGVLDFGDRAVAELLSEGRATLIQTIETEDGIALVMTGLETDGPQSRVIDLNFDRDFVEPILRRLMFRLRSTPVGASELGLEQVVGWTKLEACLRRAILETASPGSLLCVVPGLLGSIPFSLALGEAYPLAFVPSLAAAQQLRRRRLALPGGRAWRPRSLFDFVVWRSGDKGLTADAMAEAAEACGQLCAQRGLAYARAIGPDASAAALLDGLAWAELTRVACHGHLRQTGSGVDLLVAAENTLPPSVVKAYARGHGDGHLLNWEQIMTAERVSPLVVSSACDSGSVVLYPGGERLGIERPLLRAGAFAFVAPQWPVAVVEMQAVSRMLIDAYLAAPEKPLATVLWETSLSTAAGGMSPLTTRALAIFGDWL